MLPRGFGAESASSTKRLLLIGRNLVIGPPDQWNFSWNDRGVPVPSERGPSKVFKQLFINGSADKFASETHRLQTGRAKLDGLTLAHHDASHHGKDETKIEQLAMIEETELKQLSRFLTTMQQAKEGTTSLFDSTSILNVSNLSNASAHTCENLPIILAGGGYKHQGHVLKDLKNNTPLSNLFVRMLQQTGIETEQFGASEGVFSDV